MKQVLGAVVKYSTNHLINHIPSYAVRHAWYRHVLGWHIGPEAVILMGQHVQMAGVRTSGRKVSIGRGTVMAGAWLHMMSTPMQLSTAFQPGPLLKVSCRTLHIHWIFIRSLSK